MRSMLRVRRERRLAPSIVIRLCLMCAALGGCCQMQGNGRSEEVGVHRYLRFCSETTTSLAEDLALIGWTIQDLTSTLSLLGATNAEIRQIYADPFHSSTFDRVRFVFSGNPAHIVDFYSERLPKQGWSLERGMLLSEQSNAGGDWVVVYRKHSALVRVHIYGCLIESIVDMKIQQSSAIEREVTFDFINCRPVEIFGRSAYNMDEKNKQNLLP